MTDYTHLHRNDFTAKGDLISASAADTISILHVGANNTSLVADSSQTTGMKWTGRPYTLFDHYADVGNVGGGEDDLYSDTIAASQLGANGDKLDAKYGGIFVNSTSTKDLSAYFAGTKIFDTGALTISATSAWELEVLVQRESSTVVRCSAKLNTSGASLGSYAQYTRITGLTLSGTNILKLTGTSGGAGIADNDIIAKLGYIQFIPGV